MNTLVGIIIGLAIGIAAIQLGSIVAGPTVELAVTIVASVTVIAAAGAGAVYMFRSAILAKLRMKVDARAEDIKGPATAIVEALDKRDMTAASTASVELVTVLVAWQSQLRARQAIVTTLTALLALFAAVLGSALLVKQNELINNQNGLLKAQTRSNQLETAATILSRLGSADHRETGLLIGALETYGDQAFLPLLAIAKQNDAELSNKAVWAIVSGGKTHGMYELGETMAFLAESMVAIRAALPWGDPQRLGIYLQQFNFYSHQLSETLLGELSPRYTNAILDIYRSVDYPEEELAQVSELYKGAIHFDASRRKWCQHLKQPNQDDMLSSWKPSDWKSFCAPDAKPLARNPYSMPDLPPPSEEIDPAHD